MKVKKPNKEQVLAAAVVAGVAGFVAYKLLVPDESKESLKNDVKKVKDGVMSHVSNLKSAKKYVDIPIDFDRES